MSAKEEVTQLIQEMEELLSKRKRELAEVGEELKQSHREFQGSLRGLRGLPPTCQVELTEAEAVALHNLATNYRTPKPTANAAIAIRKLERAIAVERGPGGNFTGGEAA